MIPMRRPTHSREMSSKLDKFNSDFVMSRSPSNRTLRAPAREIDPLTILTIARLEVNARGGSLTT